MDKKFIKMNDNTNYLSLGNLVNIIKKYSKKKESSNQVQVFCALFNINDINNTTVNNYLIGYRPIGLEYKKVFEELKETYKKDKLVLLSIMCNILMILEEKIYKKDEITIKSINNNEKIEKICKDLLEITKRDLSITNNFKNKLKDLYKTKNLYEYFIEVLFYTVLENKQPLFEQIINKDYKNSELDDYLKINLFEGISYISSLLELSKKDNMFANAELGSLEYSGTINGEPNYEKSFDYYKKAALKNHPKACWMVAHLILMKKVKEKDINIMWHFLKKAEALGSIAAINTLGKCYLTGINPDNKIDEKKSIEYFTKASEMGYSYAYNNLGLYYENKSQYNNALNNYKISADLNNSWALNKVGELLRKEKKDEEAYFYYKRSIETPINERNYYGYYNLAKYYYLNGNNELNIKKDEKKAKEYFIIAYNNGITKAKKEIKK